MIVHAVKSCLPEPKIRDYFATFGTDLLRIGDQQINSDLLIKAAAYGFLSLIQDYDLCNTDLSSMILALKRASSKRQSPTINFLIDFLGSKLDWNTLVALFQIFIKYKNREALW